MNNTQQEIITWFEKAVPAPTDANKVMQIAVHIEEFAEMLECLRCENSDELSSLLHQLHTITKETSDYMKARTDFLELVVTDDVEFLDALCDQQVTATGIGHMYGYDVLGALSEVTASNNSKFVDGQPIFTTQGKIDKGPGYFKPALKQFIKKV